MTVLPLHSSSDIAWSGVQFRLKPALRCQAAELWWIRAQQNRAYDLPNGSRVRCGRSSLSWVRAVHETQYPARAAVHRIVIRLRAGRKVVEKSRGREVKLV